MTKYLVNALSLSMLKLPETTLFRTFNHLIIEQLPETEFCKEVENKDVVNAVGHQSTIDLINQLCRVNLKPSRVEIKLKDGDILIVVQILTRLQEGKILSVDELKDLLNKGLVKFYKAWFYEFYW